jgi:hypothetical protein
MPERHATCWPKCVPASLGCNASSWTCCTWRAAVRKRDGVWQWGSPSAEDPCLLVCPRWAHFGGDFDEKKRTPAFNTFRSQQSGSCPISRPESDRLIR